MPKNRDIIGMKAQPGSRAKVLQMLDEAGFVITQPKINGVHALWDPLKGLLTLTGHEIKCLPGLVEHLRLNYPDHCLEGEIYRKHMTGADRAAFARRTTALIKEDAYSLYVFDLPPLGPGKHCQGPRQNTRTTQLANLHQTERVFTVPHQLAHTELGVTGRLANHLKSGFEGIIIRHPYGLWEPRQSPWLLKIKPGRADDYEILEWDQRCIRLDGDGEEFTVRAFSFPPGGEEAFWAKGDGLIGRRALIRYQDTAGGMPNFGAVCVGLA